MKLFKRKNQLTDETRSFFPSSKIVYGPLLFAGELNPTVSICVDKIANTLSTLPLRLYSYTKGGKKLAVNHDLFKILEKPAYEETPTLWYGTLIRHIILRGNAYIYVSRSGGRIVNLSIVDPTKVTVQRDSNYNKIFVIDGKVYTDRQILHIPYNGKGYNGTLGISPIDLNKDLIKLDSDLLLYINAYFNNSLGTRYAIELGASYPSKPADLDKLYASIVPVLNKYVVGVENSGKPLIPPPDTKLSKIEQTSNVQAQLASLLTMVEKQIAAAFNVPYEVISGENKYGSLEQKQRDFLSNCIKPLGDHICESFEKLLGPQDTNLYVSYDYKNMLETDITSTIDYLTKEVQSGLITINEARNKIGEDSIGPEGDYHFMPSGYVPVTMDNINAYFAKSKIELMNASKTTEEKSEEQTNPFEPTQHSPVGDDKT